jgi:hypothetical protein
MNNKKKALCSLFLAGGLFGTQAQAAVTTSAPSIPARVAAVRTEMNKRVAEAQDLSGLPKLPYAQQEVASWLNWVNWPNWNNWRDWNNWRNWSNWSNWINY